MHLGRPEDPLYITIQTKKVNSTDRWETKAKVKMLSKSNKHNKSHDQLQMPSHPILWAERAQPLPHQSGGDGYLLSGGYQALSAIPSSGQGEFKKRLLLV